MRVIAGSARGRRLQAPREAALRPSTDLVRGAIFSMLEAEAYKRGFEPDEEGNLASALAWPRVLDLFAGTGSLGIEALSRGASHATFVDQDRAAVMVIRANLRALGFEEQATVLQAPAPSAVSRVTGPFDLVFLDPPYADEASLAQALTALGEVDLFSDTAVSILEQSAAAAPPPAVGPLEPRHTRTHGRTRVTLYGRPSS